MMERIINQMEACFYTDNVETAISNLMKELIISDIEFVLEIMLTQIRDEREKIKTVNQMCEESLSPELFEKWEEVKSQLEINRQKLK